jgi:hypothetical protein
LQGYWNAEERPNVDEPIELIVFCKDALMGYDETLGGLASQSYSTKGFHISDVKSRTLGFALLHEISHSNLVLDKLQYCTE